MLQLRKLLFDKSVNTTNLRQENKVNRTQGNSRMRNR